MHKLEVQQLTKKFGKNEVLTDVSFTLETGHIYGLLGRNGVGKSTLLSILNNRITASSGAVFLDGKSIFESDESLSRLFLVNDSCLSDRSDNQKISYYLKEAQRFYPSFDVARSEHLLAAFGLDKKQKLHKLSTGYRSIFNIVLALSMDVPFVFLDEPILGLDANHRELFYKELLDVFAKGETSFIISTHLIEEVSHLIDSVIVLSEGKIVVDDQVEDVVAKGWAVTGPEMAMIDIKSELPVIGWEKLGNQVTFYIYGDRPNVSEEFSVEQASLQTLFIQLTAKEGK